MSCYIDTHCHLDLLKNISQDPQTEDREGIKTITVTNAPSFYKANNELFYGCSNIRVALGLHPQLVTQYQGELEIFEGLIDNTRYIGEIGLDGSSELKNTYSLQRRLFQQILEITKKKKGKILSIHSRQAAKDTIETLVKYLSTNDFKIILHWFSGSIENLNSAIINGFYFSINHKMVDTDKGKHLIKLIPEHLILTETDAPFTFSGEINTRLKSLNRTINGIATQKNKSSEEIRIQIFENFKNLLH